MFSNCIYYLFKKPCEYKFNYTSYFITIMYNFKLKMDNFFFLNIETDIGGQLKVPI